MQLISSIGLIGAAALVVGCTSEASAPCQIPPEIRQAYDQADKVFVGTYEEVVSGFMGSATSSYGDYVIFDVVKEIKGNVSKQEYINIYSSDAQLIENIKNLEAGSKYIIIANKTSSKMMLDDPDYEFSSAALFYLPRLIDGKDFYNSLKNCQQGA